MTQDKIDYIKKILEDLDQYCRENGFKCSLSYGGGTEYSGGLMQWDGERFIQLTQSHVVRTYSNLNFRVTTKDSDYDGKQVNVIKEMILGFPKSEDFEAQND